MAAFAQRRLPRGKGAVPRWLGKTVGRQPRFLVTRHGAHLAMAANSWDVYATMALNDGAWDYHDFEWCRNGIPDSGVFYDIGANVGYFSVEAAVQLGGAVKVIAFEPQADLAAAITHSVKLNGIDNVTVIQALVGDTAGQAELYLSHASIHASAVSDSGRPGAGTVRTPMVTVDDLVEKGEIPPPDMVKMDVEGSEHLVLQGAHRTLRAHRPHVFAEYIAEFDPGQRVRRQVQQLVMDCPGLELFGHAAGHQTDGHPAGAQSADGPPYAWSRLRSEADWQRVDGLFLRSPGRPVRDASVFEP